MKAEKPTPTETEFRTWWNQQPIFHADKLKEKIRKCTGVTRQSFLNWTQGIGEPSEINKCRITALCRFEKIEKPWESVRYINQKRDMNQLYIQCGIMNGNLEDKKYVLYLE